MKTCKKCNIEKDIGKYEKALDSIDGYRHQCIDCRNAQRRKRLAERNIPPNPNLTEKHCSTCKKTLPVFDFYTSKREPTGYSASCKICQSLKNSISYAKDPTKAINRSALAYKNNPKKAIHYSNERNKERRKKDPLFLLKRRLQNCISLALKNSNNKKDIQWIRLN